MSAFHLTRKQWPHPTRDSHMAMRRRPWRQQLANCFNRWDCPTQLYAEGEKPSKVFTSQAQRLQMGRKKQTPAAWLNENNVYKAVTTDLSFLSFHFHTGFRNASISALYTSMLIHLCRITNPVNALLKTKGLPLFIPKSWANSVYRPWPHRKCSGLCTIDCNHKNHRSSILRSWDVWAGVLFASCHSNILQVLNLLSELAAQLLCLLMFVCRCMQYVAVSKRCMWGPLVWALETTCKQIFRMKYQANTDNQRKMCRCYILLLKKLICLRWLVVSSPQSILTQSHCHFPIQLWRLCCLIVGSPKSIVRRVRSKQVAVHFGATVWHAPPTVPNVTSHLLCSGWRIASET